MKRYSICPKRFISPRITPKLTIAWLWLWPPRERSTKTLQHYQKAVKLKPGVDRSPTLHYLLGMKYAEARRFHEAILATQRALDLARAVGDENFMQEISKRLALYRQLDNSPQNQHESR